MSSLEQFMAELGDDVSLGEVINSFSTCRKNGFGRQSQRDTCVMAHAPRHLLCPGIVPIVQGEAYNLPATR